MHPLLPSYEALGARRLFPKALPGVSLYPGLFQKHVFSMAVPEGKKRMTVCVATKRELALLAVEEGAKGK